MDMLQLVKTELRQSLPISAGSVFPYRFDNKAEFPGEPEGAQLVVALNSDIGRRIAETSHAQVLPLRAFVQTNGITGARIEIGDDSYKTSPRWLTTVNASRLGPSVALLNHLDLGPILKSLDLTLQPSREPAPIWTLRLRHDKGDRRFVAVDDPTTQLRGQPRLLVPVDDAEPRVRSLSPERLSGDGRRQPSLPMDETMVRRNALRESIGLSRLVAPAGKPTR